MRHYVMTRSAYGPEWDRAANERRLHITAAVTVRLMEQQTTDAWAWVVLLDRRDPLLSARLELYAEAAPDFEPIVWTPPQAPWDDGQDYRSVAADFMPDWRAATGEPDDTILTTRLDDDDGLAVDALARYQRAAAGRAVRTVLVLPRGIRVWNGRASAVRHETNAMHTLVTPPGDTMTAYDYGHREMAEAGPVVMVDEEPGWLWVRHRDTISGLRTADVPISDATRELFPVDWDALDATWAVAA